MVVCTYFQQGRCKFGDRCKYEHPGQATLGSGNRFGVLSGASSSSGGFGARQTPQKAPQQNNYGVTAVDIKTDLTPGKGRPEWIFSAYGPGRNAPVQLFGGPQRELSFEEMRVRHYQAAAAGHPEQAVQEAQNLYAECLKQMDAALNDLDGAVKYVLDGENQHPNRNDITEGRTGPGFGQGTSAFGQPSVFGQPSTPSQTSAFGQPSSLGAQSAFGKPSALGQQSAFGQPSPLGQKPAFGQPTGLGQGSQGSTFGQPSALGGTQPAFGKPAFGQPAFGQPSFGQPSTPGTSVFGKSTTASPFGQTQSSSGFGQPLGGTTGFGQPSGGTTGFGQPSGQTTASPFGKPPTTTGFGQPSTTSTGFGQPSQAASPFAQLQKTASPFGQPAQPSSAFGATTQQQTTASPFGQPATTASPFAKPPVTTEAAPAAPAPTTAATTAAAGLGPKPMLKTESNELNPFPNLTGQTVRDQATKKLTMWKGQPVKYIDDWPCYLHPDDRQTYVRIFFPDGPPDAATLRDAQAKPEEYIPEVTESYQFFLQNGYFKDGVIPSVPPKTEWVSFDF
ncbi:hypothetical protein VTN00DRAFT_1881 [Thermoascus crustaceus]|uniref:uncharacterized protein n=1 Tax=Thermoascus crustaceus TaxID=5088 RepID=UPI00374296F4